uniref:MuF-C-terminal domain-containing protein n=1 Tax=Faecalibacterium prausnitzii TaxID=853 RepID=UPI003FED903D
MRESNPSKAAESSGWTAEKVRAIRTKTPNPSTASSTVPPKSNIYADALQQYAERHISDMGEVDARNDTSLAGRVSTGKKPLSQAAPAATEMALDMGQKWGVPAKSGNVLENVGSGAMAYGTGPAQELRASFAKDSVPDEFDRINQWLDTGDNKNLADAVRRVDNTHGAYTDADLIQKGGWTQAQIDEARKMNAALDAIPAWKRDVRRAANTIGGIGDTVAAAPVLGAEYGVQAGKNIDATLKNWKQVEQEVKGDEHAQSLFDLLTDVDMDYNPTWPESRNRELISMGYNSKEIREMRQRLAGLEVSDGIDKNQSVGYQLYDRGQQLTAAAQSGLSPTQRAVAGAVTSAAENLAVAGVNPAAVLPILSAQGAAEAMGQSAEKGESAGKALGGGLAKFGAGWAINSVGAADLAKTMGSDYAKDTLAGQIADWVQGLAGSSELAKRYPAVAAAISGGIDNSMQAFAETYADMAIDAALGDSEAAKNLFSKDTFLTALESGLSGGASGALGGAVGSRLRSMSEALDREAEPSQSAADSSADRALAGQDLSVADATAPLKRGATGVPGSSQLDAGSAAGREMAGLATEGSGSGPAQQTLGAATREQSAFLKGNSTESMQRADAPQAQTEGVNSSANETAVNDDPAVHTAAQNAGIEEYKNSVDPGLAEYVDRVRAGEKLEPYVVAETGDRMRSAMMELTGLEKVGDRTLMDSNAVQHITNRHAGGDGSADGTMKESADMARAAYVLNNFDNAYLAKDRADGYFDKRGKHAPIVIFEKKIDGSHVVVEAVCDTKKNKNFIVSEYLAKNGVGEKEIAKALRSPVNAVASPGDNVRNVVAGTSAASNIAPESGVVNSAERAGTAAQASRSYAEETLTADESGLDASGWASGEQKAAAARLAREGRVSTQGVQTIVDNMPGGIGAGVYTQAAKALYRMGVNEVGSFAEALKRTGPEGSMGGAVRQVLALGKQGENALKLAYLQGKGEAEVYNARKAGELGGGKGVVRPDAGTVYRGDKAVSEGKSADEAFLKLTAQSTGTAIHRMMQGLESNAKGYIKAAAGEMFFAGDAGSETVMHETFHALNQWSAETGQAVMDQLLNYLVQRNGAESTEKLIQSYLDKYAEAGQQLTYNQALEEITADAMETVFGTAESFRDFVRQQAAEARMNAEARGIIGKVMDKIQNLLESVLADVEHFLKKEPTNAAAKAAKSLTEEQLQDLRALYFEHQMTAGEKYREAIHDAKQGSKNTAASETKDAAVKYSIDVGFEKAIEGLDEDSTKRYAIRVGSTSEVLKSIGVKDKDIFWQAGKLRKILNKHSIANHNAATGEGSIMTKEILKQVPQVLEHPIIVLHSDTSRNADYASRIFMYGDVKDAAGKPVNVSLELLPTDRNGLVVDNIAVLSAYGHESYRAGKVVQGEILYVDPDTKRTAAWLRGNRLRLPFSLASGGSKATLHYADGNVKAVTAEPLPGQPLYYLKAVTEAEAQKLYPEKAAVKYQLEVDADSRDAANSSGLGDVDAQMETIQKAVETGGNKRISEESLRSIAQAVRADHGSKVSAKWLTERLGALSDYLSQGKGVDWADANAFVMDIAEQIMQKSSKRNDELWKAYPELHKMSMQLEKGSAACGEILYRYGSWANARKEAARHGVSLTYTKDGQASRWDGDFAELQKLGAGLLPTETPSSAADALEAMMSAHDAIKPTLENAYDEDWDGAKQDIAMQIWQRYMNAPEMAIGENAQLREQFAAQRKEVRDIARQQALEARAKAQIAAAQQDRKAQDDLLEPYRKAAAKANYRKEVAEQFAKKQKASVEARVQLEKDKRLKQVQKARDAREMDNTRRSVQKLTSELTRMIEKPSEKSYVPEYLVDKVRPVAALANDAIGNHEAAKKLRAEANGIYGPLPADMSIRDAMDGLKSGITREMKMGERAALEWKNSKLADAIDNWLTDVNENRQLKMEELRGQIEQANKWLPEDTPEKRAWLKRLNEDLQAYRDGAMASLSVEELRGLREIMEQTMFIVKNEAVMLGSIEDVMIDDFAEGLHGELKEVAAKQKKGVLAQLGRAARDVYRINATNIERNFERFGGYAHGGFMEQLGQMLNDGQARKNRITAEGEAIFADLTGPKHEKELYHFTHDLVDIGLKTENGRPWLVTHDVMAELWVQLQNRQGMHHLLHGGATIADMSLTTKGLKGVGRQRAETVKLGELVTVDESGNKLNAYEVSQREDALRTSIIGEIEKNLTEYDNKMIAAFRELGKLTKGYINETSLALSGVKKARVDNYIRLHVDRNTNVEQNTGIQYDNSVGSEGFLQSRVNSSKPLELVGLVRQAAESIENTAQYAGMAIPLRNAEKVLNSMQGGKSLYGQIEKVWGETGRSYLNKALADLCGTKSDHEVFDRLCSTLRGNAAAAVLTGNLNVTLLQAASLPTAAAELGWGSTGKSVLQFVKNVSPSKLAEIEKLAYEHGDAMLPTRLRGSRRGELGSTEKGVLGTLHDSARNGDNAVVRAGVKAADAIGDFASGSIGKVDEITTAALYYGAMEYVKSHPEEFDAEAAVYDSPAYWEAVKQKYQRVIERTQPNYTAMQRTGFQRTKNQMAKTLMMFSTQRQQNAQILVSALEDAAAQAARYKADPSAANKEALETAKARRADAISSQIVQTALIAGLGVGVKLLFHKWGDLQDENGGMTVWSLLSNFIYQFFNSGVSNFTGGSEAWRATETVLTGKSFGSYDTISMTGFSAVNDMTKTIAKLNGLLDKDTSEMTEEEFAEYEKSVRWAWADAVGQLAMLEGVPYNNVKKYVKAVNEWMDSIKKWKKDGKVSFDSAPSSATGQYDRLYNAIQSGDREEAAAAMKKLEQMRKEGKVKELKVDSQLKTRLKKYDEDILEAAKAQNAGKEKAAETARKAAFRKLLEGLDVKSKDSARRAELADVVTGAVNEKANELLAAEKGRDKDASVYADLLEEVETGRAKDVQAEISRLLTAGKKKSSIKSKITEAVKEEYLAGSDRDREKLEKKLLALEDAEGNPLYEEKDFAQWVSAADKKVEKAKDERNWWEEVK